MRQQFRINDLFAQQAARHLGTPDLVHAWSGSAEPSLLVARKRGVPSVLERSSSHMLEQCRLLREEHAALGLYWEETPRQTVERELREYELAEQVFVPSEFVRRTFVGTGFPAARLFANGFGVDLSLFQPAAKADHAFRVVCAGSLSVRKGIHHLADAFRQAGIAGSELLLIGAESADTNRLVGRPSFGIRRIGHVPQSQLPTLYQQASVFVMASIEEGQAMVQAQALACGLPLVCSANTGGEDFLSLDGEGVEIAEGVLEFSAGYVVRPGDASAIAFVLRRLFCDPSRLASMRRAAITLAQRDLSWRRYATANLKQYKSVVCASRSASASKSRASALASAS